mgnify:FL=1
MTSLTVTIELECFLRILMASLCGYMIGYERTRRLKEAVVRTHCVVACGAALMMVVSKYGFSDIIQNGVYLYGSDGADASRIAAQVVSGVGFLGAGVIFRTGTSVKGLTTAAGIWATSAVGLAFGAGLYLIGWLTTIFIVAIQFLMHRLNIGADAYTSQDISLQFHDCPQVREQLFAMLEERGALISGCSTKRLDNGDMSYHLCIHIRRPIQAVELQAMMDSYPQITAFSV